jgi:hypothetical protein
METYKLEFIKDYSYAHNGILIKHYGAGQLVETDSAEFYESALKSGCAKEPKAEKQKKGKG